VLPLFKSGELVPVVDRIIEINWNNNCDIEKVNYYFQPLRKKQIAQCPKNIFEWSYKKKYCSKGERHFRVKEITYFIGKYHLNIRFEKLISKWSRTKMSERLCCVLSHEGENTIYGLQFSVTKLICLCVVLFYSNGISLLKHTHTNLFRLTCANQFFEKQKQKLKSYQFEREREKLFFEFVSGCCLLR